MAYNWITEGGSTATSASAHLSDDQTQTIAVVNTPQAVEFNTHDDVPIGITHSNVTDISEIYFDSVGRYGLTLSLEVHNGSGGGELYAWMEHTTDSGATWLTVANSAVVDSLSANTENVLILVELFDAVGVGCGIRFLIEGDSTGLELDHRAAVGNRPAVPSAMLSIHKV
tara:strand:+ start:41 stop:550 length:510 start_codon:yes stop_codon:yes gene_type:complete